MLWTKCQAFVVRRWMTLLIGITFVGILFMVLLHRPQDSSKGLENIKELQLLSGQLDEWIKMENTNYFTPLYDEYYKSKFGSRIGLSLKNILYSAGLMRRPPFSLNFFKQIVSDVTLDRLKQGWKGRFIQKISFDATSRIAVFGACQGALHGLVRYLEKLRELNFLDDSLRVTNPHFYLIFLGNVVSRSPYSMEILSVLLRLMKENPTNVILLRGANELQRYWIDYTLGTELKLAFQGDDKPLQITKEFFETLPIGLYGIVPSDDESAPINYINFKSSLREEADLKALEQTGLIHAFLSQKSPHSLESCFFEELQKPSILGRPVVLKAVIEDIRKKYLYEEMDGLRLVDIKNGVPYWTLLSTSAEPYRLGLNYFYDAFGYIIPAQTLDSWIIRLYNRDVRNKENTSFNERNMYLFTGKQAS